jgi:mono/diheme cytochrome c family protein
MAKIDAPGANMSRLNFGVATLAMLPALLCTLAVQSKDAPDAARGKAVFEQWCAACHAPGPYHPGTQALEAKYHGSLPAALQERRDLKSSYVRQMVRSGVSVMPFFRKTEISDAALADLGAYLMRSP